MSVNRRRVRLVLVGLFAVVAALVGCGKKGPLYLPKDEPPPAKAPATPNQEPDKDKSTR